MPVHDLPPMVSMGYNKDYYPAFAKQYGFIKSTDHFAYYLTHENISGVVGV